MRCPLPRRLLLGPGPSNVHPRVLQAMTASLLGHLDPDFLGAMDDVRSMLRDVFFTTNGLTLPVSGTGTAGMEAAMVNMLETGDTMVMGTNGYFGMRLAEIARRAGAEVFEVDHPMGQPVSPDGVKAEVAKHDKVKLVAVVHAETSTGVVTPIPQIAKVAHEAGHLFGFRHVFPIAPLADVQAYLNGPPPICTGQVYSPVVAAVTSLGGVELRVDDWDIDVCYSGTQKCLGAPPGLAPITFGERALATMDDRKTKVQSFYLDMTMLRDYWQQRVYHHTAPISMIYALREALRIALDEGMENRWLRHTQSAEILRAGLEAMGLSIVAKSGYRLPSLTAIRAPEGVAEADVRKYLLQKHSIEVSGGLAGLAGQVWRVGLMGHNSNVTNVLRLLSALEAALAEQGFEVPAGEGVAAAQRTARDFGAV